MDPYWGPVTANYDWCEANYVYTPYVAELFNTLSSVPIALLGLVSFRAGVQYSHGPLFLLASAAVVVVGLGSAAFHGTLLRSAQMLDEIPMLWCALLFLWVGASLQYPPGSGDTARLGAAIVAYGLLSTVIYLTSGFEVFVVAYVATVVAVSAVTAVKTRSSGVRSKVWPFALASFCLYAGGFLFLWIPEQVLCGNRREVSHESALLRLRVPLHSYFHLTSAVGPFCWLTFAAAARMHELRRPATICWRPCLEAAMLPLPLVVTVESSKQS